MPVLRYFMFVGGALLALLLIVSAWMPSVPPAVSSGSATDLSVIRIRSDHKWPDRVVFDTTRPTIAQAPTVVAQAPLPPSSEDNQHLKSPAREAFAELRPNPSPDEHRSREPKRKRRSVAKNYGGQPKGYAMPPRFMVAQQRPVFFFGNNIW